MIFLLISEILPRFEKVFGHRNTSLFLFCLLDVQNNFMFPKYKDSQRWLKNQKSTDKRSSFDGLIQEDVDLSDIHLAVAKNHACLF